MIAGSIVADARSLIGTKFRHQGRDPRTGIDCVGLLIWIAKKEGLPHEEFNNYGRDVPGKTLEQLLYKYCDKLEERDRLGSVILFDLVRVGVGHHVGIRDRYGFIHAMSRPSGGVVRFEPMTPSWEKRIKSAWLWDYGTGSITSG